MSRLVSWARIFLDYIGLSWLYKKNANILFLGLDNAGKTTLMHLLRDDVVQLHEPTMHPQAEELDVGGIHFKTHDMGGHAAARRTWRSYFHGVDGIVFLVDASDRSRLQEASEELSMLLQDDLLKLLDANEKMQRVPIVVMGNKIDVPGAASEAELRQALDMPDSIDHCRVVMCSVVKRRGVTDAFAWLGKQLA